jgi:hypothetical protein
MKKASRSLGGSQHKPVMSENLTATRVTLKNAVSPHISLIFLSASGVKGRLSWRRRLNLSKGPRFFLYSASHLQLDKL